jgi:hypothetical protein
LLDIKEVSLMKMKITAVSIAVLLFSFTGPAYDISAVVTTGGGKNFKYRYVSVDGEPDATTQISADRVNHMSLVIRNKARTRLFITFTAESHCTGSDTVQV